MDRTAKLGLFLEAAGLAILGTLAVLLAAGALGHPVTSDGALPWWGPVSRWGMIGAFSAVAGAMVFLALLGAVAAAIELRARAQHPHALALRLTSGDAAAIVDQLTGRPRRGA